MNREKVLILGASSDIGCEIISEISDDMSIILAHYNSSEKKLIHLQSELHTQIVPIKADLLDEKQLIDLINKIKNQYSHPTKILFLAAPKIENIRFKNINWEDYEKDLDVQLKSSVFILKEFLPMMADEKKGKIIFMLSSYTLSVPPKALSHYITVKYALLGFMKSLASEYSEKNIQINAVSPSMVETSFLENIPDKLVELASEAHPLKRNAVPHDIAPLIKFLLSEESNYITGINIPVCGGVVS